jgi:hypothetical protein
MKNFYKWADMVLRRWRTVCIASDRHGIETEITRMQGPSDAAPIAGYLAACKSPTLAERPSWHQA